MSAVFSRLFEGYARAAYGSFSKATVSNSAITFNASGFDVRVGAAINIFETSSFSGWFGAGLGLGLYSAGDTALSTSSISSVPLEGKVTLKAALSDTFSAFTDIGYQANSLGSIPYSVVSGTTYNSATLDLSGIFINLGVVYAF